MFEKFDPLKSLEKHLGEFDFNSRVPFYNDSSDYTTNAPSYYDDLARKNKLIKHLAKRIWDYDIELAKRFAAWDKNLEEFDDEVLKLLEKWMADGTFDHIINHNIFNQLNKDIADVRSDLIDELNELNNFFMNVHNSDKINVKYPPPPLVGAKGDGITDDSTAIQNIINSLKKWQRLYIPDGDFKLGKMVNFIHDNMEYEQRGTLIDNGIRFTGLKIRAYGIKVVRKPVWADGVVGLHFLNCNDCTFHIDELQGFDKGMIVEGNEKGNAYNNYYLDYIIDNRTHIFLTTKGMGWTNENTFYGGRLAVNGNHKDNNRDIPGWAIVFDDLNENVTYNGNKFLNTSIESQHNGIQLNNASYVYIEHPRFENIDDNWIKQNPRSNGLTLISGYTPFSPEKLKLDGSYNVIIGRAGGMNAITVSGERGYGFTEGENFPALRSTGGRFNFYDGTGEMIMLSNTMLRFPNMNGIINNALSLNNGENTMYFGRVKPNIDGTIGDIVFNTNAKKDMFAGWIFTDDGWFEFGKINPILQNTWNGNHFKFGNFHQWYDQTGRLRSKFGKPNSETDGKIIGPTEFKSLWDEDHLMMGGFHLWFTQDGTLRSKFGKPNSETDGKIVGNDPPDPLESTWNGNHLVMGNFHFWVNEAGQLMSKFGKPTSETDGNIVGG